MKKSKANVKVPRYCSCLGNGKFSGTNYQCVKCGKVATNYSSAPPPGAFGRCPDTSSGNHIWQPC